LDKAGIFLKFSSSEKEKETGEEGSIEVDEILQMGDPIELNQADNAPYREMTLDELNQELDKAVRSEDYEKAAKLRDEISKRNQ
jgi:excinuclease UvrABC helicase subunit UvrB